jgi:primosomal protein N' (replication factor Y)
LIEITIKHTDKKMCRTTAQELTELLRTNLEGVRVLGPGEPMISKIRNQYLMSTLIKIPRGSADLVVIKNKIMEIIHTISKNKEHRNSKVVVDVDPV